MVLRVNPIAGMRIAGMAKTAMIAPWSALAGNSVGGGTLSVPNRRNDCVTPMMRANTSASGNPAAKPAIAISTPSSKDIPSKSILLNPRLRRTATSSSCRATSNPASCHTNASNSPMSGTPNNNNVTVRVRTSACCLASCSSGDLNSSTPGSICPNSLVRVVMPAVSAAVLLLWMPTPS